MFGFQQTAFLVLLLYATLVGGYAHGFVRGRMVAPRVVRGLLVCSVLAHLATLIAYAANYGFSPMGSPGGAISSLALCMATTYFLLEWITGERNMGLWILTPTAIFQAASLGLPATVAPLDLPESPLLGTHVGLAMIGFCAFSFSAVFSVLYLLLYRDLKRHRLGLFFERMPSLESLEHMSYRAIQFGLGFLMLSIALGEVMFFQIEGHLVLADVKIAVGLGACAVYGAAILLRNRLGLRGRRLARLSIAGYCLVLFSLFVVDRFLPGFHRFH